MPEMNTVFSRLTPSSRACAARSRGSRSHRNPGTSARPGRSVQSLLGSSIGCGCVSHCRRSEDCGARARSAVNGMPLDLVEADRRRRGTRRGPCARAGPCSSRGRGRLAVAAQHVTRFDGNGLRCTRCAWATFLPRRGATDGGAIAPHVEPQPMTSTSPSSSPCELDSPGCPGRCPRPSLRAAAPCFSWFSGAYEMLPVTVVLLDAADAVLEAGRARHDPRARERLGIALVGQKTSVPSSSHVVRLGRERPGCRAASRGRAAATAPRRSRCSRRTAGSPASGTSSRSSRPRSRRRSSAPGSIAARIGHRRLAVAAVHRLSRSAASVFVGRPVDGPPRWMSMTSSGSSVITAEAHRLALERDARTARRRDAEMSHRTPHRAPRPSRRSRPRPGTCGMPKFLYFASACRMTTPA